MLIHETRRMFLLTGIAALLGVLGGAAAWLLLHLIALLTNLLLFGEVAWTTPDMASLAGDPRIIAAALVGAVLVSLLARWSPVIRGHGIPEAMEAILERQSRIRPSAAVAKPVSAAIAIGSGAPFGAEGPIIVTGGSLGSLIGQVIHVSPSERKILLAAGAAAGMTAVFGAPLAAVVLAIELLLFEFSTRAFIPLAVAAGVASGMHIALFGAGPLFHVPHHEVAGLAQLPVFVALGIGAGLLAVLIAGGLFVVEGWYRRLPVSEFWHPMIGALIFAAIGLAVPRALGVGYDVIDDLLANRLAAGTVAVLVLAKLLAWWAALGSGTSGGTLAPILLISAGYGCLFGAAVAPLGTDIVPSPGVCAVVAMAATFGAATRATFTAMVFVFELTRDYELIVPLMVATVIADLLARVILRDSIMTEKLSRRGVRVPSVYQVDAFATVFVRDIMSSPVMTVPATATVGDARVLLTEGAHSAYPVVDGTACVGIVSRVDLLRDDASDDEPVLSIASRDVVSTAPSEVAGVALTRMMEEEVEHLPVVEGGRLVGICTRTDLLRVRARSLEQERRQPGLHARLRTRIRAEKSAPAASP